MKFDLLCEYALNESNKDYLTGKSKLVAVPSNYDMWIDSIDIKDLNGLVGRTKLPITKRHLRELMNEIEEDAQYSAITVDDVKKIIANFIAEDDMRPDKELQVGPGMRPRVSSSIFRFLKNNKLLDVGATSTRKSNADYDLDNDTGIEKLADELPRPESEWMGVGLDNIEDLSPDDIIKFGGSMPDDFMGDY